MKTKELGSKENHINQTTGIKDSEGDITVDQRQVLKISENHIKQLWYQANRPDKH
jgi:hypothetical protein